MPFEFINRRHQLDRLVPYIQARAATKRPILIDSPAGMGKTKLLVQVCRELIEHDYRQNPPVEWRIVRLDFRNGFPGESRTRNDILKEIARQLCRGMQWNDVLNLIQSAGADRQMLVRQAVWIPQTDEEREELLGATGIPAESLARIRDTIASAFRNVDLQRLWGPGLASDLQIADLVRFILQKRAAALGQQIVPDNILLVLDGLDALQPALRNWTIGELALGLHRALGLAFQRFVVIVSGRSIAQGLPPLIRNQYNTEYVLEPFPIEAVEDAIVRSSDIQLPQDRVSRLARQLLPVCGGHPQVLMETIVQLPAVGFALDLVLDFLCERRDKAMEDILGDIDPRLIPALELLSVFRRFNVVTLEMLAPRLRDSEYPALSRYHDCLADNVDDLFKRLVDTRLISEGLDSFYSDRIALGLITAQMQDKRPELFRLLNRWATEILEAWIKEQFYSGTDQGICVREWLFHRLCQVEPCQGREAVLVSQKLAHDLRQILSYVAPFLRQSLQKRLEQIGGLVEQDQQIDYQIWQITCRDERSANVIYTQLQVTFEIGAPPPPPLTQPVDLVRLRQILVESFNEAELRELCFDLHQYYGVDYDNLGGEVPRVKAMELILYFERRGFLPELVEAVKRLRPKAFGSAHPE